MAKLLDGTRIYGTGTVDTILYVNGSTPATSTATGALQLVGGLGVWTNAFVGGNLNVTGQNTVTNTTAASNTQSGALRVFGGIGVGGISYIQDLIVVAGDNASSTSTGAFNVQGGAGIWNALQVGGIATVGSSNRTDASTTNTGVVVVQGGLGVWNSAQIGGIATIGSSNRTNALTTNSGVLIAQGGAGIWNNLFVGGGTYIAGLSTITNFTAATSTSSGALQVRGGVGIGGNLYVGGGVTATNLTVRNNVAGISSLFTNTIAPTTDQITISNAGFPVVTAGVSGLQLIYEGGAAAVESSAIRVDVSPGSVAGGVWNSYRIVPGAAASGVTINGVKFDNKSAGAGTSNAIWVGTGWDSILSYGGTNIISGTGAVTAQGGTNATSTNTGALVVQGGAGIWNDMYVGGIFTVTNTTNATSTTTGGLIVAGGVGIGNDLYVGNTATILGGLVSTPGTELALQQTGDTFGPTILRMQNRTGLNGALFDASLSSQALVDFGFKTANAQRNIRFETRPGITYITGGDGFEFQIGSSIFGNATLVTNNIQVLVNPSTNATSTATGALMVKGGAGIWNNLFVGGNTNIAGATTVTNTTVSTSTLTGALTISGGIGIGGSIFGGGKLSIGDSLNNTNIANVLNQSVATGINAYRSINLIDTAAVIKVARVGGNPSIELQEWDASITSNVGYWDIASISGTLAIRSRLSLSAQPITTWLSITTSSGIVTVSSTASSISTNTGALVVQGGVGLWNNLFVGGNTNITGVTTVTNTTNATNTQTGALRVVGGIGVGTDLWVGGNANILSTLASTTTVNSNALYVAGGAGIATSLYVTGPAVFSNNVTFLGTTTNVVSTNTIYTDNILELHYTATWTVNDSRDIGLRFRYFDTANRNAFLGYKNTSGYLEYFADSTETQPGGVVTPSIYGTFRTGNLILNSGTNSLTTATGALQVQGGAAVWNNLFVGGGAYVAGLTTVTNTTNATSTSTGALVVAGGVGVKNDLYLGGIATVGALNGTNASTTNTGVVVAQGGVGIWNALQVGGIATVGSSNRTDATSTNTGVLIAQGGVGIWNGLQVGGNTTIAGQNTVTNATNATTTSSGALRVYGGAGIGNDIWVGNNVNILGSASANSTNTGALRVFGGIGTNDNLYVNGTSTLVGTTTVTNFTAATSTSTGALQVRGGVGIGGALFVGTNTNIAGATTVSGVTNLLSNVAIGATTATARLTVSANATLPSAGAPGATNNLWIVGADSIANVVGYDSFAQQTNFISRRANGTASNPTALVANDIVFQFAGRGYGTTGYGSSGRAQFDFVASENWTDTAQGTYITFTTTPNGSATSVERVRIDQLGNVLIGTTVSPNTGTNSLVVAGTATSTSTTTGAVVVSGGVGIGGALFVQNTATILSTTSATSTTTGALIVQGGVGIQGNLALGGAVYAQGTTGTVSQFLESTSVGVRWTTLGSTFNGGIAHNPVIIDSNQAAISTNTGDLQVLGGIGVNGSIYVKGTVFTNGTQILPTTSQEFAATAGQTSFTVAGGYSVGSVWVYANGVLLSQADYTAATSPTVVLGTARKLGDVITIISGITTNASVSTVVTRIGTVADTGSITPTGSASDQYNVTALAQTANFNAPSGTPFDGQKLTIRIKDNGVSRILGWDTTSGGYRSGWNQGSSNTLSLPTATSAGKVTYVDFVYNSQDTYWDLVDVRTLQ